MAEKAAYVGSKSKGPLGSHASPKPTHTVTKGADTVKINGNKAARKGDELQPRHSPPAKVTIREGSGTVSIEGKAAARVTDGLSCGDEIKTGSGNVKIGD